MIAENRNNATSVSSVRLDKTMKTYDEFKTFYSEQLTEEFAQLEKLRKRNVCLTVIAIIGLLTLFPVTFMFVLTTFFLAPLAWAIYFACYFFIGGLFIKWIWTSFYKHFKYRIVHRILHFIHPALEYDPKKHIGEFAYDQSGLFLSKYNRFKGEDLIKGTIDKTTMKCSEIHVEDSDDESSKTIFKGLFMVADFNKNFQGKTFVLPDKAEKLFGRLGQSLQKMNTKRGELIKLEDAEFEKKFVVYGTDQVEARYILTPALMQKIVQLHKKNNTKTYLSFLKSKVYIAIALDGNLFEPTKGKEVDYLAACQLFEDLSMTIGIVEDLDLNTRIWTKE